MRAGPCEGPDVKKIPVKVYLSREQIEMLDRECRAVGEDRSGLARTIILNHLKDINLVREAVHSGENIPERP